MKELVVRYKDDFDHDQIADVTIEFTFKGGPFDGVTKEIDLTDANADQLAADMARYIAVARKAKRRSPRKTAKPTNGELVVKPEQSRWTKEIHGYAAKLGYDWDDKAVRDTVRQWGIDNGLTVSRTGVIRRDVLDDFHKAHPIKRIG